MDRKRCGAALRAGLLFSAAGVAAAGGSDLRLADAVMRADREAVRTLLQQKIDVNAGQPDGTTALHWAVRRDDLETAQLLIRAGAQGRRGDPLRRDAAVPRQRQRQCRRPSTRCCAAARIRTRPIPAAKPR